MCFRGVTMASCPDYPEETSYPLYNHLKMYFRSTIRAPCPPGYPKEIFYHWNSPQEVSLTSNGRYNNWDPEVDLYSCNVPLVKGVGINKVMLTHALQNYWTSGSSFQEVEATEDDGDPKIREKEIRERGDDLGSNKNPTRHQHRNFQWAPKFGDIQKSIDASPPGNDGWAIHNNYTRYTRFLDIQCARLC